MTIIIVLRYSRDHHLIIVFTFTIIVETTPICIITFMVIFIIIRER